MQKHAYLIMSHNDFYILEKLLRLLDDRRNDIYVHIDKKVKNFDFKYFKKICKHSEVKFIKRIKVYWLASDEADIAVWLTYPSITVSAMFTNVPIKF